MWRRSQKRASLWLWVATCADTKLVPSWLVGGRDGDTAIIFTDDLANRLANRVQITSDGHKAYLDSIAASFGGDVDYAMLVKIYGPTSDHPQRRQTQVRRGIRFKGFCLNQTGPLPRIAAIGVGELEPGARVDAESEVSSPIRPGLK
jgi:hypothetical protein